MFLMHACTSDQGKNEPHVPLFVFVFERIIEQFLSLQEACTSTNYEICLRDITISLRNLKSLFKDIQ